MTARPTPPRVALESPCESQEAAAEQVDCRDATAQGEALRCDPLRFLYPAQAADLGAFQRCNVVKRMSMRATAHEVVEGPVATMLLMNSWRG